MENNICVSSNQLLIITIIFIISIIYIILHYNDKNNKYLKKLYKYKFDKEIKEKEKDIDDDISNNSIKDVIIRDNLVLSNNLYPPLNRYPLSERNVIFNNHTRDSYDTYHLVGNLTRITDNF
jgi:hypothetical protein